MLLPESCIPCPGKRPGLASLGEAGVPHLPSAPSRNWPGGCWAGMESGSFGWVTEDEVYSVDATCGCGCHYRDVPTRARPGATSSAKVLALLWPSRATVAPRGLYDPGRGSILREPASPSPGSVCFGPPLIRLHTTFKRHQECPEAKRRLGMAMLAHACLASGATHCWNSR